jgi:hypothetical protein
MLHEVFVKDCKRGFALALDKRVLPFVRDLHLTPLGIVDLDNPWKNARPVFDSTFRPDVRANAINDWVKKEDEFPVQYPGSFMRFLQWIWNLRITYPNEILLIGDNDICGAFRLIKYNPEVVPMHGYRVGHYLGLATGQTFGDSTSPGGFEPTVVARQQHARWLWKHRPTEVLERMKGYVDDMTIVYPSNTDVPFAQANVDSLNKGVKDEDGNRLPPVFPHQVDDCFFADTPEFIKLTSAASIAALEDVFDVDHPNQEKVLSLDKLELGYAESRLIVGHVPNTRRMVVELSPRRREKVMDYITKKEWNKPNKTADIREIATLYGLLTSASEFFPWAQAQLCILQDTLRECIVKGYRQACAVRRRQEQDGSLDHDRHSRELPKDIEHRLLKLRCQEQATMIWRSRQKVRISDNCRGSIKTLLGYMRSHKPWEQLIGHIVPREPAIHASSDASEQGIGVKIDTISVFCVIPLSDELIRRATLPSDDRDYVHINALEFVGVLMAYIIAKQKVMGYPQSFPPAPVMHSLCDNKSAIAWCTKISTKSILGQNLLKLFAEFLLDSPLGLNTSHIRGIHNTIPDLLSRPCELYTPQLTSPSKCSFQSHITQVCRAHAELESWEIFLPSPDLLSVLLSTLSSKLSWARPEVPKNLGQFVPAGSISSGSCKSYKSTTRYSL